MRKELWISEPIAPSCRVFCWEGMEPSDFDKNEYGAIRVIRYEDHRSIVAGLEQHIESLKLLLSERRKHGARNENLPMRPV